MKEFTLFLIIFVFVTRVPSGNASLNDGQFSGTSKIIRFFGDSRVGYKYSVLPREMMVPATEESLTLMFITEEMDGLMWMFKSDDGSKMHISLKNGNILFVHDAGRQSPQQFTVRATTGPMNDYKWHTFRVDKNGNMLKFYIDNQLISEEQVRSDLQFVEPGSVDLGGTRNVQRETNNLVRKNFDGAITDVVVKKKTGPNKEMIVRFLQIVDTALQTGNLQVWDYETFIRGGYSWRPTTAPPPIVRSPITFISGNAVFYLKDVLDFRQGGSIDFRFRTLEPRGLLAIARVSASSNNYFALEIFDGILYFVYNFDGFSGRKQFPLDNRVDDGEWHNVSVSIDNGIFVTLDNKRITVNLSQRQIETLYFYRLYIGGYDEFSRIPWEIYSRQGYKGCMESFRVNDIPVDLHSRFRDLSIEGARIGCQMGPGSCLSQPCTSGFCQNRMGGYICDCSSTPYTGQNCGSDAVIASWDGTRSTTYNLLIPDNTHTNDISFRFLTPLSNTLLFSTESRNQRDYVRAEIVNGKVVVTFNVSGQPKKFETSKLVNDYRWHTLYIRRRADDVEVWVDDSPRLAGMIGGENYVLNIAKLKFGSLGQTGSLSSNGYIGYMQNFIYDNREILGELKKQPNTNVIWITNVNWENVPLITYKPVTVSTAGAHFQLPSLKPGLSMKLMFKFKTREPNGLMLYNAGPGDDVIAIELSNGKLRVAYNLGMKNMFTMGPSPKLLNDNMWHTVQVLLNEQGQLTIQVDGDSTVVSNIEGDKKLNLFGKLYIGGLPEKMFNRQGIRNLIESRQGFRGCFASMDLNGAVPELINYATDKQQIFNGCTDLMMTCKPDACGTGMCMPGIDSFWCDCNMTGFAGDLCEQYPVGYYFGKNGQDGVILYEFPFTSNSDRDRIAFGFMTRQENAVLYRIVGNVGNEYIEIRLENGHVVAESNTGGGITVLKEAGQTFNDGQYHVVRYIRTGTNSTLQVDQLPTQTRTHSGAATLFDKVYMVVLGGRVDGQGVQSMNYNGILAGAYYNGYRWMNSLSESVLIGGQSVQIIGDVVLTKPFKLVNTRPTTPTPPPIFIPPDADVPGDIGGGGSTIGGTGTGPDSVIGIGGPGGEVTVLTGGVGINVPGETVPMASALVGPAPPPLATGARAGAVVGTVLGTMAFMTSLMWALYKLKPGVPTCLSPGAGSAGAGAGGGGMNISSPRTTSNLGAVQAASAGGGGGGAGAGSGASAGSGSGALASKVTVVNGSASGGGAGGAGGGSTTYTSYFQSTSTSVGGGGGMSGQSAGISGGSTGGADHFDSATLRATGTFSNKGTAIGSPKSGRAHLGSSSTGYSANYQSNTMQSYSSDMGGGSAYDRQHFVSASSGGHDIPDYDMPISGTLQSGQSYSSSTLNTHYNYQMQNVKTVSVNRQGQYVLTTSGFSSGAVTPGAAGDEVRVDCCVITADGRYVVTGSSCGPPQVWDMQTGELQNIMKGDTTGSTRLHLLCGDRLLVGAVHCDKEINELSSRKGVFNHALQIWDFSTGNPMAMGDGEGEYCSALCPMTDSDKVLFGRTDKFGDATSIIAWDLMGNQMIKEMRYEAPVGNNDYINFLKLSKNDRYVVAGFTNSFDNCMEFMVFDMTLTSFIINEPSMLKLDANQDCTVILPKDEAVTGLRNGDLVIWSIRTGQPSRQLLGSGGAHAHSREIKAVCLSEDGRYLVSASADGTLKVWDLNTERPIHTLAGHSDEVWCCDISIDNEIIISGSSDGTIRLWRMKNGTEMCVFNCGVDIFSVTMSRDKGTIVALGDKFGTRKLIMLQVVRTKIKKIVSS